MVDRPKSVTAARNAEPVQATYPLAMTGDPWLDGVIYARGAMRSASVVDLKVGKVVEKVTQEAHDLALELGLEAELLERIVQRGQRKEVLLRLTHREPVFSGLPRYRDRRLPSEAPEPFLAGYLHAATEIVPEFDLMGEPREDTGTAIVATWRPDGSMEDVLQALDRFGAKEHVRRQNKLHLSPQAYQGVELFEELRDAAMAEEAEMRREIGGRSRWDELSDRMLVNKDNGGNLPVVYAIMERRVLIKELIDKAERAATTSRSGIGSARLPYERHDEVKLGVYWDYIALYPRLADKNGQRLTINQQGANQLLEQYDNIIDLSFPLTKEYRDLMGIARKIQNGKAIGYGRVLPRDQAQMFLPKPRPRNALMEVFIDEGFPAWFRCEKRGVRLETKDKIMKGQWKLDEGLIEERIAQLGPVLLDRIGTLTFLPDHPPPGKELLRHCTTCDQRIVLSNGATCRECGAGICIHCETRSKHCGSHRNQTGKEQKRPSPDVQTRRKTGTSTNTRQRDPKTKPPTSAKEIKIWIDKSQYKALHGRKIVTGKTLTQMVGEALDDYLESGSGKNRG